MFKEFSTAKGRARLRVSRAISRLQAGHIPEAIAEAAELTKTDAWAATEWYNLACIYAVACGKDPAKKDQYAPLHRAVKAGWNDAVYFDKDKDLDPLRGRVDFERFRAQLQAAKAKE